MKALTQNMDFEKEEIRSLPIWIQVRITLKYSGETSLFNIVAQIGDHVQYDEATKL